MSEDLTRLLLGGPLGSALSTTDAAELGQRGSIRKLEQGEALFRIGEAAESMFVVLDGSLQVRLGSVEDDTPVATLTTGQLCGELEAMTRSLRVATVAAEVDSEVFEFPLASFDALLEANHSAATRLVQVIAKTLARRLAAVNQRLTTRANEPSGDVAEIVEIIDTDVTVIEEEDLEVLDRLWS